MNVPDSVKAVPALRAKANQAIIGGGVGAAALCLAAIAWSVGPAFSQASLSLTQVALAAIYTFLVTIVLCYPLERIKKMGSWASSA